MDKFLLSLSVEGFMGLYAELTAMDQDAVWKDLLNMGYTYELKLREDFIPRVPLFDIDTKQPTKRFIDVIDEIYVTRATNSDHTMSIADYQKFQKSVGDRESSERIIQAIFESYERPSINTLSKKSFMKMYRRQMKKDVESVWVDLLAHGFREDLVGHPEYLVALQFSSQKIQTAVGLQKCSKLKKHFIFVKTLDIHP